MRRSLVAVAGTMAGLAALLGYKSGPPPTRLTAAPTTDPIPTDTAPTSPPTTSPGGAAHTTPTTAPPPARRTATGPDVPNRFGDVQVRVTMSGGRLVDVTAMVLPTDRPRSAQISQQAAPILRSEALSVQSANIDIVSGATYTSESYARSLQGAIDAARAS